MTAEKSQNKVTYSQIIKKKNIKTFPKFLWQKKIIVNVEISIYLTVCGLPGAHECFQRAQLSTYAVPSLPTFTNQRTPTHQPQLWQTSQKSPYSPLCYKGLGHLANLI